MEYGRDGDVDADGFLIIFFAGLHGLSIHAHNVSIDSKGCKGDLFQLLEGLKIFVDGSHSMRILCVYHES